MDVTRAVPSRFKLWGTRFPETSRTDQAVSPHTRNCNDIPERLISSLSVSASYCGLLCPGAAAVRCCWTCTQLVVGSRRVYLIFFVLQHYSLVHWLSIIQFQWKLAGKKYMLQKLSTSASFWQQNNRSFIEMWCQRDVVYSSLEGRIMVTKECVSHSLQTDFLEQLISWFIGCSAVVPELEWWFLSQQHSTRRTGTTQLCWPLTVKTDRSRKSYITDIRKLSQSFPANGLSSELNSTGIIWRKIQ